MNDQDQVSFVNCMLLLAQTYCVDLTAVELETYWICLRIYPFEALKQAILSYQCDPDGKRFMPKPGEIIQYIEGSSDDRALSAWAKIIQAVKHIGAYRTVIFDDPIIHAVLHDMGGWIELCAMGEKERPFREHEFIKRYKACLKRPPTQYPKQLTGLIDMQNSASGYENKTPAMVIGDTKKAWLVFQNGQTLMQKHQSILISQHKALE